MFKPNRPTEFASWTNTDLYMHNGGHL